MTDETQIKDDLMYMSLTNGNHVVVYQGHSVKAQITKLSPQPQPFLKRPLRALQAVIRLLR